MQQRTDSPSPFAYDNICKGDVLANAGSKNLAYKSKYNKDSPFVYLERANAPKYDPVWKIHISLLNDAENLPSAWNLVKEILTNYGIDASKVLRKDCYYPEFQLGKEITIYDQPTKFNWQKMLNEITVLLIKNNIKPGFTPINDQSIKGSNFISFRCDINENNKKVSSLQAKSYKPPQYTHDFEHISIDHDIVSIQPPKPQRANEKQIKEFYSMLESGLAKSEDEIFAIFTVNGKSKDECALGDEIFYHRIIENYLNTNLITDDNLRQLKEIITLYEKINHEFNYFNFNIANKQQSEYSQIFGQYEQKFKEIDITLKAIQNHIQAALETLSNPGSVVEKGSTPGSPSSPLPSSPKENVQIHQALAAHPIGPTVVSAQDRMILEIGKKININPLDIEDLLDARILTSEHIKNIFNIIKSRGDICDVIVAGLNARILSLAQVRDVTQEIITRLSTTFERELHSRTLTPQSILQKLELLKNESETPSAHVITAEQSSSSSFKPPGQK